MKILHVIPYFTPKLGGDVNVCYHLCKHLVQSGHEVTIITTDFKFDENYANLLQGIEVIPFKCYFNFSKMLISPGMKKWLKKEIKNFDIIHLHDFRSYQNIIVHKLSIKNGVPYIIHGHGSVNRFGKKWLKFFYDVFWGYSILKHAAGLVAVSNEESIHYKNMGADERKIKVIYNGVDTSNLIHNIKRGDFREKYNLRNTIILYLGRIHKTKGLDFLLYAFSNVSDKIKSTTDIVFVGSDEGYKKNLLKLGKKLHIENNLRFIGPVDEIEKISAYIDSNLFVNPARYMAGVALTTIEALLYNLPVITTAESGEIIQKAKAGYIVNYGEINELRNKIEYALENPDEIYELTNNGKKYIKENLSWNDVVRKIEKIYENCNC